MKKITLFGQDLTVPDSPHFRFDRPNEHAILYFSLDGSSHGEDPRVVKSVSVPTGYFPIHVYPIREEELWILPVACDVARSWFQSKCSVLWKKCSDEDRVHYRYGIEDEPEYDEFQQLDWDGSGWAVAADKARTKLGWPTPMPTEEEGDAAWLTKYKKKSK